LDFYNSAEEIKEAFDPYYTSTILSEETSPNKLNDLLDALEKFEVYNEEVVKDFFESIQGEADRTILDPIIDSAAFVSNTI
jgi:type I restriction enzyme R subunit